MMDSLAKNHNLLGVHQNNSLAKDNSLSPLTMPLIPSVMTTNGSHSSTPTAIPSTPTLQTSLSTKAKHFSIDSLISTNSGSLEVNINKTINKLNVNNFNNDNNSIKSLNNELISDDSNDESISNQSDLELLLYNTKHNKIGSIGSTILNDDLKSPSLTPLLDDEELSSSTKTVEDIQTNTAKDCRQKIRDRDQSTAKSSSSSHTKSSDNKNKPELNPACLPRCNCEELTRIDAKLETKDLWEKFHELGTEMIITKTGRRYELLNHLYKKKYSIITIFFIIS